MIIERLDEPPADLERRTGWTIKPQGACRDEQCVPLPGGPFDVRELAARLGMALVHDEHSSLWALGPPTNTGRALASAQLPDIVLPDRHGADFALRSLRGTKVFMIAWASW
jgi:hypothetical protein